MINTSDRVWLLVDNDHAQWSSFMEEIQLRHRAIWEKNRLSVVTSDDGSLSLVKVAGGRARSWKDQPHIQALFSSGVVVRTYTIADHSEAKELLATSAWSETGPGPASPFPPTSKWLTVRNFVRNLWNTWTSR